MEEKPNYYAIIPADVRYDPKLTSTEKLLYGEITSLTQKIGECWASNKYFANLYDVEPQSISRMIKHLTEREHITYKIVYKENKKEIEKRIISIPINKNVNTYYQKCYEGINKNVKRGINKNVKENNTSINITSINNKKNNKEEKEKLEQYIKEVGESRWFDEKS